MFIFPSRHDWKNVDWDVKNQIKQKCLFVCLSLPLFFYVNRELSSTFARLCNQADISKEKIEVEIKELDKAISQLTLVSTKAKSFR